MSKSHAAMLLGAAVLGMCSNAQAYRRVKLGPFELVPSFALDLRHHSNVYVESDDAPQRAAGDSGFVLDFRPGLNLVFRPKLEKQVRGLFFDLRYSPSVALFPNARIDPDDGSKPDEFKLDHNVFASVRYQASSRLTFSVGAEFLEPELSLADDSLQDFSARGGVKYDIARPLSIEGTYVYSDFVTPKDRTVNGQIVHEDSPLGSFTEDKFGVNLAYQPRKSTTVAGHYRHRERSFGQPPPELRDFNKDGVFDNEKSFTEDSVTGSVTKLLTPQVRGTIEGGYIWRKAADRNFGPSEYSQWTGSATLHTLLTKRTRIQSSAEYTLTDTVRRLSFEDIHAFTNDQIGQFTVLPEQFSVARSKRFIVDVVHSVFRRGDQIILGAAIQQDQLLDQFGTGNFFIPGGPFQRDLTLAGICEQPKATGQIPRFCQTILSDQDRQMWLVSLGYRMRVMRWLGIQGKATYFDGETSSVSKDPANPGGGESEHTSYWNVAAGVVVNLQVFQ